MSKYQDKLRDPRWQRKRLEIMQRDGFRCVVCDDGENELNIHHCYYARDKEPWEYEDHALATLCVKLCSVDWLSLPRDN
jgi:5-methylcytosine-specific restriction endonuclease McrA